MLKVFLMVFVWFTVASFADKLLRNLAKNVPSIQWLHLDSLAFVVTLYIGAWIEHKYPGPWFGWHI